MNSLNCIIIEDEPLAAEILEQYIGDIAFLKRLGSYRDALLAVEVLQQHSIDVIFLDLHLPKIKGFEFLKSLKNPPQIIVTTAYHQYALDGFELDVCDYLLKPISFARFLQAVNKLERKIDTDNLNKTREYLFFNVSKKMVKVHLDEILYIESQKEYVKIFTESDTVITKSQIGQLMNKLPASGFIRVHRSYVVSKSKVTAFTASHIEVNEHRIPIGRSYRNSLSKQFI